MSTQAEKDAAKAAAQAEKDAAKAAKSSVSVTWSGGARTYSREIHGDNFNELAKEFAKKHNGQVV
jgi:hypothetical protein